MTTYQDPPPQSRRAVRQSERGETAAAIPDQGTPHTGTPYADAPYAFDAAAAAASAPEPTSGVQAAPQSGRRAQQPPVPSSHGQQPPTAFEPLTYSTQERVFPPLSEQNQQQPLAAAPPPAAPASSPPPTGAQDLGGYRVRDFSPESGRRAAAPDEFASNEAPLHDAPAHGFGSSTLSASASFPAPSPTRPVDLGHHTQGVAPLPPHSAGVPVEDTVNHTLTRRELREMRAAAEQQAPPLQMPESIGTLLNSGPIDIPTLAPPPGQSQALAEAMAEFDLLTRARREAEARARDAQVASLSNPIAQAPVSQNPAVQTPPIQTPPIQTPPIQTSPFQDQQQAAVAPPFVPSVPSVPLASAPQAPTVQAFPSNLVFPPMDSVPAPAPTPSVPAPAVPAPFPFSLQPSAPQAPLPEPPVFTTPIFSDTTSIPEPNQDEHGGRSPRASSHWRVQAAMDDDELPYENTLSRTVGLNTSAITTSALVLPSVPQPDSILASLGSTGEILVTGSINLPRSLGSTGAHPDRVDHSDDEDDLFDSQVAAPDSAPVRAIRAVSTNTSTRGVIETKRPQSNRLLTGVIVVACVLCVGLVGLLVFAFATGKL